MDRHAALGGGGRRPGARPGGHALVGARRPHRRQALPRHHELRPAQRRVVRALRDLGGRPRDLGRRPGGRPGGRVGHEAPRRERAGDDGRRRPRDPGRAGHRAAGQLLQSGALRRPDEPAVGARRRPVVPPGRLAGRRRVPPDLPLRDAVELRRGHPDRLAREAVQPAAAGRLLPVRDRLLRRPHLVGGPARRPGPPVPGAAAQLLGGARRAARRGRRPALVAAALAAGERAVPAPHRPHPEGPPRPVGSVPRTTGGRAKPAKRRG